MRNPPQVAVLSRLLSLRAHRRSRLRTLDDVTLGCCEQVPAELLLLRVDGEWGQREEGLAREQLVDGVVFLLFLVTQHAHVDDKRDEQRCHED